MRRLLRISTMIAAVGLTSGANANLLVNGGFETPVVPGTGTAAVTSYAIGQNISGWQVVGTSGVTSQVVSVLNSQYAENSGALHFTSQEGNQHADLTGPFNQGRNGVQQTVATVTGATYTLSFWVGNQTNSVLAYANASSVEFDVNGANQGIFTNNNSLTSDVSWLNVTQTFVATGPTTTLAFFNVTPTSDNFAGLDNVDLTGAVAAIPEPVSASLLGLGMIALGALRRRRSI